MMDVAVVGFGRMGQIHYQNLLTMPHINVKYIFDPQLKQEAIDPALASLLVSDLAIIKSDEAVKLCVIAAPSSLHVELIESLAHAKKNIFCEKPIAFDPAQLERLKALIHKQGITLHVGFNRRFDPSTRALKQNVANKVGDVQLIKITNRDPLRPRLDFVKNSGGLFFDFCIHDFDTLRFVTGLEIVEVYAMGNALIDPQLLKYGDVDTTVISLLLSNGALALIDCSRETGYGYDQQIEVFGSKGMLHMKNHHETEVHRLKADGLEKDKIHKSFLERYRDSYRLQLNSFCAPEGASFKDHATIDDTIASIKAASAALTSYRENRSVLLEI